MDCFFALVEGSARESPGAALIAPQGAVLEQDALGGVVDQQTGRAEAPPEPAAVAFNPGVTGIAGTEGTAQFDRKLGLGGAACCDSPGRALWGSAGLEVGATGLSMPPVSHGTARTGRSVTPRDWPGRQGGTRFRVE